ncbi:MAG: Gfo/Idh/MocA family oxidoreductase [Candidatus Harrisonbacteria bacterium]|nr:Gfo/Idh/MocA family oxidoreductase [Candidatus Harrisonbacteria bacterium]
MAQTKKRAVIIGAGNIGVKFSGYQLPFHTTHMEAYLANPEVALVAIADPDRRALQSAGALFRGRPYADYREMLRQEKPELASICTPDQTHFPIVREVLKHASVRGIWCEKPLAISLAEAKKMVADAGRHDVKLSVNFIRRYDPFYAFIKKHLGALVGDVQAVSCYYSGGIVTTGSHLLDLLVFLFGPCDEVSATSVKNGLVGRLRFGSVWVSIMPLDTKQYSILEMNIFGSHARLDTINKPFGVYDYRYYVAQKDPVLGARFIAVKSGSPISKQLPRDYMDAALQDLLDSVRKNREPRSSGQTALASLEIMHALLYSSEKNGVNVRLPFRGKVKTLPQSGGDVKKL